MPNKRIYKRTNPFSKQSEEMEEYNKMQKGLDKFSRLNPKAYMTLLD